MKLLHRFLIVLAVVGVGLAVQGVLFAHLSAARDIPPGKLTALLATFPMELGDWIGQDTPIEEGLKYADDHMQRAFIDKKSGQQVTLWMVYSDIGEDRSHHPEICFQVAGQQEDLSGRRTIEAPGHEAPIEQMRFGNDQGHQYVYYWHYTLPSPEVAELNGLQRAYKEMRRRPASVTIEVFAPEMSASTPERAAEFVMLADAAMQSLVGPDARRGSKRLPVTFIEGTPTAGH